MNNWTNVLLAVLLAFELATGLFGLVAGASDREFILILHNIGAFAIIAIAGWKVLIVAGSLRRRSGGTARIASLTLATLVLLAFGLGLSWSLNGFFRFAGITGLNWHMFAGIATLPIAVWHALKYTRRLRTGFNADRRAAIKLAEHWRQAQGCGWYTKASSSSSTWQVPLAGSPVHTNTADPAPTRFQTRPGSTTGPVLWTSNRGSCVSMATCPLHSNLISTT